jgi:hypothetical protein
LKDSIKERGAATPGIAAAIPGLGSLFFPTQTAWGLTVPRSVENTKSALAGLFAMELAGLKPRASGSSLGITPPRDLDDNHRTLLELIPARASAVRGDGRRAAGAACTPTAAGCTSRRSSYSEAMNTRPRGAPCASRAKGSGRDGGSCAPATFCRSRGSRDKAVNQLGRSSPRGHSGLQEKRDE